MPELLPFQRKGAAFLAMRRRAFLADEQRVGKTPQAIAASEYVEARSVLVLCPAVARPNWLREFIRWAGRVGAAIVEAGDDPDDHLTVCSYSQLINQKVYRKLARRWDLVVADEHHFLKNDGSKRTAAALRLITAAGHAWFLSGTPMPAHAGELYPLLHNIGAVPCSYNDFLYRFCDVSDEGKVLGNKPEELPKLRAILSKVMLRRTLAEVAPEMPPMRWERVVVDPGAVDGALAAAAYEACEGAPAAAATARTRAKSQEARLRDRLAEAQGEIDKLDPRDSLWFRRFCALQKIEPITDLLTQDLAAGVERVVVFGWHVDALRAIAHNLGAPVIDGDTPHTERQRIIDAFDRGAHRAVCAQIVTAGTAINLAASDEVLFVEQSWTPSDNAQAVMRVVSQFKTRPTRARVVSIAGSIDGAVQGALLRKTRMVSEILNTTGALEA